MDEPWQSNNTYTHLLALLGQENFDYFLKKWILGILILNMFEWIFSDNNIYKKMKKYENPLNNFA